MRTTRWWMNLLAPVAKPVFQANHDYVMRNGGEGIAKLLGARLLAIDQWFPRALAIFMSLALSR